MNLDHQRLFSTSTHLNSATDKFEVDVGGIFRRLLLFDTYILHSTRLKEFPALVNCIGLPETIRLIEAGCLRINLDPMTVGQIAQSTLRAEIPPLPKGFFDLAMVVSPPSERKSYVSGCFRDSIDPIPGRTKDIQKLKWAILNKIELTPESVMDDTLNQLRTDFVTRNPLLITSVSNHLRKKLGIDIKPTELKVQLNAFNDRAYELISNLKELYGLNIDAIHQIVEAAVCDVAGMNQRIAEMKAFNATSGFKVHDLPLFEEKLDFIVSQHDPNRQEERAQRVINLLDLPDFRDVEAGRQIDVDKFLKLRESAECIEFRNWLPNIDRSDDKEIVERIKSLRSQTAEGLNSKAGRTLRLVINTAVGLIPPPIGTIAGTAYGVLESYLFDRIFKKDGVRTFVGQMYPSLFGPD